MATIKFINSKTNLKRIIDYVSQPSKTNSNLLSGKDCSPISALEEMNLIKKVFNKEDGRTYLHIIQSFDPKDDLTHEKANKIGLTLAKKFKGYQVLVATHKDKDHIHNHLIVNSVSFEHGKKLHHNKKDLQFIKNYSDKLCLENNLSIIKSKTKVKDIKQGEYQAALKGDSWKFRLINVIDKSILLSTNKNSFIKNMEAFGYKVNWSNNRKHITYTTPEGFKCRDNKLHNKKYLKEAMENEFGETESLKSKRNINGLGRTGSLEGNERMDENNRKLNENFDRQSFGEVEGEQSPRNFINSGTKTSGYREENSFSHEVQGTTNSGNEKRNNVEIHRDRNTDWNSIMDVGLFLDKLINDKSEKINQKIQKNIGDNKQAKIEYAIKKQTGKSINWEKEDEWER